MKKESLFVSNKRDITSIMRRRFTLIELLVVIAIITIPLRSKNGFFMAIYGNI